MPPAFAQPPSALYNATRLASSASRAAPSRARVTRLALRGEIKLPGMANVFYRERVDPHLRIGMQAIELLRRQRLAKLHSRKLRSFADVAFQ